MKSTSIIAEYINLKNSPVAIIKSDTCPEGALQFKEDRWGCVIALLNSASKGKVAALSDKTVVCPGGKAGTGFRPYEAGKIEYFLSVGGKDSKSGELYKESPELARDYINGIPQIDSKEYLLFKPLSDVCDDDEIETIVFLVNADQLSGLVTLANYDQLTQDNVRIKFGSGCSQSILYSLDYAQRHEKTCTIGLTDPSARKCINKDILSFSIPYDRFLELEAKASGSFFSTDTWETIRKRID